MIAVLLVVQYVEYLYLYLYLYLRDVQYWIS
jgi:hypothetical protein